MDLSILLAFEVVGLVALAAVMTGVLIWGDLTRSGAPSPSFAFPMMAFCPRSQGPAQVRLGGLVRDDRTELQVLECDHFPHGGIYCQEECLELSAVA